MKYMDASADPAPCSRRQEALASSNQMTRVSLRRLLQLRRRLLQFCGVLVLAVLPMSIANGANEITSFDEANKLYEQGKFTEAASAYQKVLQSGHASAAVYYNLGNAFFKAGRMGQAVAAYRQAEQISPRDPDLRANLQFARNQIQGPTLSIPAWQRWLGKLSLNEWTWLAVGTVWLWFLLLVVQQCRAALKPALKLYVLTLGLGSLLVCACLGIALRQTRFMPAAIVIVRDATVRQGPLDESQTAFTVHDGAELRVLDRKDDWLQVTADPRRIGWVRSNQVVVTPQS